jgi:N-acetylmuramoyl-L-alanine amidase
MNTRQAAVTLLLAGAGAAALGQVGVPVHRGLAGESLVLSAELTVRIRSGRDLELALSPRPGDTWSALAARWAPEAGPEAVAAWNGLGPGAPLPEEIRLPLAMASSDLRRLALGAVFPADGREDGAWVHRARAGTLPTYGEGLAEVAAWFTGDARRWSEVARANGLAGPELSAGQRVRIPDALLHPAFAPRPTSADGSLEYGSDREGRYAGYRLKGGEALYSAVVLRYTGRTSAEDVQAVLEAVQRRSGIARVTDIPVGWLVKVPFDLLEPEFLPESDPARRAQEQATRERAEALAKHPLPKPGRRLEGVLVVLDPGHGGRDLGTMSHGIWEHDYVYDLTCRLKRWLETHTRARVVLTLQDLESGTEPSDAEPLLANHQGTVPTHPPFLAKEVGEAPMGVNLRWYLANALYREARAGGGSADRVVFLSLHADARHPALRGAMVYVPAAARCAGTHGFDDNAYRIYREVRAAPFVSFPRKDLVRSEAVSRKLAESVLRELRDAGLPVQAIKPVRDRVLRGDASWVPAVLRANAIPAKLLIEVLNLSNAEDAALLRAGGERQRIAEALGAALIRHFGERPVDAGTRASRRGGPS